MVLLGREFADLRIDTITIKENDGSYTSVFTELLKDYYLYLQPTDNR
jgi:hypothetical protein